MGKPKRKMRVGLVLGAGGVMGGAWLTGALHALATETGWDPGSADVVVGTSAGAMIGSLCAAGVPPWFMVSHSGGESFEGLTDARGEAASEADRSGGAVFRLHRGLPQIGPGSLRLGLSALARPGSCGTAAALSAWLPAGLISTDPLSDTIRRVVPEGWADHPELWVVACDYGSGERVVFGRHGSPDAELADAVAASCAIPAFYRPVAIGGRRYIDGGACSMSNLDLVAGERLDLAICLNPTSSRDRVPVRSAAGAMRSAIRDSSGRRLGREARSVRESGADVVMIQPTATDIDVMGPNPLSRGRRHDVIEKAIETVAEQLRAPGVAPLLTGLPRGEPERVARPVGPAASLPGLRTAAAPA